MPTVTGTEVQAYCHCRNARCAGYSQQAVPGIKEETAFTYGERGGDGPFVNMVESSMVEFKAANEDDIPCPSCGEAREVTGTPRPSYQNESGHDPMGLLASGSFNSAPIDDGKDARIAALEAKIDKLLDAKDAA